MNLYLGLLTEDGKYNLMAQLLSDNSHIPVRFSLFSGESKSTTMYSVREFGNTCLLYSLDDVLRYGEVLNIPQADERNRIVERKEVPLFHAEAYREAVINALQPHQNGRMDWKRSIICCLARSDTVILQKKK